MTMIRGVRIMAAPCCGARFSAPRYLSMNFMALAFWTIGGGVKSLSPMVKACVNVAAENLRYSKN